MYTIKPPFFSDYNLSNLEEFVDCWSSYYKYTVKIPDTDDLIDYFEEINLDNELNEDNVTNLLRWKDPRYLTKTIKSGPNKGASNDRVFRVLNELTTLNKFRSGAINEEEFKKITSTLFPNGVIWEIFIFHICKPFIYPIADQHVFRSFNYHKKCQLVIGWEKYEKYKAYFSELINMLHSTKQPPIDLEKFKKLDNALMVFGQFLNKYEIKS